MPEPRDVIIGVDLGPRTDWTAIVAVHRAIPEGEERARYDVFHLERGHWELRGIIERVRHVISAVEVRHGRDSAWLVLDRTGVGEFVAGAFTDAGLNPIPLVITGGDRPTFRAKWGASRRPSNTRAKGTVPKRDLVGVLQVLLEMDRLRFAKHLPGLKTLVEELENFRAKISTSGHDTYEAWREGAHDDTVLATALACWFGEKGLPCIQYRGPTYRAYGVGGRANRATEIVQAIYRGERR